MTQKLLATLGRSVCVRFGIPFPGELVPSQRTWKLGCLTILVAAHNALESLTLDRETMHYKQQIALKYADLVYYGLWFCQLREALDAFVDVTQRNVTGDVKMKLYKGQCTIAGIKSRNSLYQPDLASFKMGAEYDSTDATGFIRLFGLPAKVAAVVKSKRNSKST